MSIRDEMIAVAVELLTEFGFSVTIRPHSANTYDPTTLSTAESNTGVNGLAAFFDPSNSAMTGYEKDLAADGKKGGKWMFVQTDADLKTGDVIEYGARKFKINALTEIGPTSPKVFYRVKTDEL